MFINKPHAVVGYICGRSFFGECIQPHKQLSTPMNRRCTVVLVALIAVCIALALGLMAKFVLDTRIITGSRGQLFAVSWAEFGAVAAIMTIVITPVVLVAGNKMSIDNILRYEQFVNGVETVADVDVTTCYEGHSGNSRSAGYSNCDYSHVTSSYTWEEPHTTTTCTSDAKGNSTCTTSTYYTTETGYIYTPFATKEFRFYVDASAGKGGDFPRHYYNTVYVAKDAARFRSNVPIPASVPRGAPADWLDAKQHLVDGDARPTTMISSYDNYILASDDKILKAFGGDLARYKKAGLLPDLAANITTDPISGPTHTHADKVAFVGVTSINKPQMQNAVMRFNAALGMTLQGDLHVVFVDSNTIGANQAVNYTTALKAYWQGPTFAKRAIAKNGIILVIGVKDSKVDWARASTGMPFGNESMAKWVEDWLPGQDINPRTLFGEPRTVIKPGVTAETFKSSDVKVTLSTPRGALEEIMFEKAPFSRARMSCDDNKCVGFKHLIDKIEPTGTQKTWMVVVTAVLALMLWLLVAATSFVDDLIPSRRRSERIDGDGGDDLYSQLRYSTSVLPYPPRRKPNRKRY